MQDDVPLRQYVEALREADQRAIAAALAAADRAVAAALAAADRAVAKAEAAADKRMESLNELRQAMIDQQKNLATVEGMSALADRVGRLELAQSASGGQSKGIALVWGGAVVIVMAGLGLAALVLR